MPVALPHKVKEILDRRVFAHVSSLNPDGSPHSSVVWVERQGDQIVFSTTESRIKARNLRRDPRVALSFTDPEDPYRAVSIQGRVISMEHNGSTLIDRLAHRYVGPEKAADYISPGERIDLTIIPEHISAQT